MNYNPQRSIWWLSLIAIVLFSSIAVKAQTEAQPAAAPLQPDPEVMQRRLARARALSAAHNLPAAALELDSIISATNDDTVREIARLMLMGIYLEEADYTRADALLVATYKARSSNNEASQRSYFALAGQTVNGARAHLERYRSFGINIADRDLPQEALNDLDRIRLLLERVVEQAKEISDANTRSTDAAALLEDVISVRSTLARDDVDRQHWQQEFADARQRLATSEARIAPATPSQNRTQAGAQQPQTVAANASQPSSNSGQQAAASPAPTASPERTNAAPNSSATSARETRRQQAPSQQPSAAQGTQSGESAAHAPKTLNVGPLLAERASQKVSPSYPPLARSANVTGMVTVFVEVDERGAVVNILNVTGPQMLRQAAIDAARRWRFQPAVVEGQPARMSGYLSFNFTL